MLAVTFVLSAAGNPQQFEQVSVRPAPQGANAAKPTFHSDAVTLNAVNTGLRQLIQRAYAVEDYQIVAPDWLQQERFDLAAKFPEFATGPQDYQAGIQTMMQKMLAERFHLAVHKESRILQVYAMSVEKSGIKFRETTPGVEHTLTALNEANVSLSSGGCSNSQREITAATGGSPTCLDTPGAAMLNEAARTTYTLRLLSSGE